MIQSYSLQLSVGSKERNRDMLLNHSPILLTNWTHHILPFNHLPVSSHARRLLSLHLRPFPSRSVHSLHINCLIWYVICWVWDAFIGNDSLGVLQTWISVAFRLFLLQSFMQKIFFEYFVWLVDSVFCFFEVLATFNPSISVGSAPHTVLNWCCFSPPERSLAQSSKAVFHWSATCTFFCFSRYNQVQVPAVMLYHVWAQNQWEVFW